MRRPQRVGLIVPSSNTTIETEIPAMLSRLALDPPPTFHSSRAVLHNVDAESLDRMVADSDRCARELSDAHVDVLVYACLVALMASGKRSHEQVEAHLAQVAEDNGSGAPVISSAGALVRTLQELGAQRIAIMTPYMPPLTELVGDYLADYGFDVAGSVSLSVPNNRDVAELDPQGLLGHARKLDLDGVDVLVASACVQMPSLAVLESLEQTLGLPVISAATATTAKLLDALALPRNIPGAGGLLLAGEPGTASATH
ncbi:MAG: maleate isomerase [Baekduia sp.]|nr:maleate isomerase [Baekduia sp.]